MKNLLFAFILLLISCDSNDPEPEVEFSVNSLGLGNHTINEMVAKGNLAYIATDKGFYKGNLADEEPEWDLLGFSGQSVESAVIIDENNFVISVVDRQNVQNTAIYKSTNGGVDWVEYQNGFGGSDTEPAFEISKDPQNENIWYGVGYNVVAKSENSGQTWTPVFGNWQGFASGMALVRVNPNNDQQIWAGGQNAIEQGFLLRSTDGGENWTEMYDLLPAPTVAKEMAFHPTDAQTIFAGFEGGLLKTINNGNDWTTAIDEEDSKRFFFGIVIDPDNPLTIYSGGWLKRFDEPQPFVLYRSTNGGTTWNTYEIDGVDYGGVYDMIWVGSGQNKRLLVGFYKGGVYELVIN
jgi:hypothetical protein